MCEPRNGCNRAREIFREWMRMRCSSAERRPLRAVGSGGLRAARALQVNVDDFASRIGTTAAAPRDGQYLLHFHQTARALIDDFANLPIGDGVANTDVHKFLAPTRLAGCLNASYSQMRMIVNGHASHSHRQVDGARNRSVGWAGK